jgi:hypothetical protein
MTGPSEEQLPGLTVHEVGKQVAAAYRTGLADGKRNSEADRAALAARLAEVEGERDAARAAVGRVEDYVTTVERIHAAYRHLVMDTDEDRERHARLVDVADRALAQARAALRGEAGEGRS